MPRVFNVAEKPSAAKAISSILSAGNGGFRRRNGRSRFHAIFDFPFDFEGQHLDMRVTSVAGHIHSYDFTEELRSWNRIDPVLLFDGRIEKKIEGDETHLICDSLSEEARKCEWLILWLDGDREGENISFEVVTICTKANPRLRISRARFSALTPRDIFRAMHTLDTPKQCVSDAVDLRREVDLRIGAAFTRFQTLRMRKKFPILCGRDGKGVISYGPCQFPTLGFVVQRHLEVERFVPENFWYITLSHEKDGETSLFSWMRRRLFDRAVTFVIYERLVENPQVRVINVNKREKRKWRPLPLSTVEMQKLASRKLRLAAERTMHIAEELYNSGYISYPRTETDKFTLTDDELKSLIREHENDQRWGDYTSRLLEDGYRRPRQGRNDDKAHPPIHPTKNVNQRDLDDDSKKNLYEMITRHFLACCSEDAIGSETDVKVQIMEEEFSCKGLCIEQRNYLDVYPYEQWNAKKIPRYIEGEEWIPKEMMMKDGRTTAPPPLSEADLISAMDRNGIGTDATIAQHVKMIQDRCYAEKHANGQFFPTKLGLALVNGYNAMGYELSKPYLRARMESDLRKVSEGTLSKVDVLRETIAMYRDVFVSTVANAAILDEHVGQYYEKAEEQHMTIVRRGFSSCSCGVLMDLCCPPFSKETKYLICRQCNKSNGLPVGGDRVFQFVPQEHTCPLCNFQVVGVRNVERNTEYNMCPHCFNELDLRCFQCNNLLCPLSGGGIDVGSCPSCQIGNLKLKRKKDGTSFFLGCSNFKKQSSRRGCSYVLWLPPSITSVKPVVNEQNALCPQCRKFNRLVFCIDSRARPPYIPPEYETCVFCDRELRETLNIREANTEAPQTQAEHYTQERRRPVVRRGDSNTSSMDLSSIQCFKCKNYGHYANSCPEHGPTREKQGRTTSTSRTKRRN